MIKSPCHKCKEREVGCHSTCEKYAEFRQRLDEINEREREAKYAGQLFGKATRSQKMFRGK